jgi:hypothetical protein
LTVPGSGSRIRAPFSGLKSAFKRVRPERKE